MISDPDWGRVCRRGGGTDGERTEVGLGIQGGEEGWKVKQRGRQLKTKEKEADWSPTSLGPPATPSLLCERSCRHVLFETPIL